jgi:NADH-quinone oxidoreductase subunit H
MSTFISICFLGGWLPIFGYSLIFFILKILVVILFFIWVRATLPRYRFDQLLILGWKNLLPLSLGFFIFFAGLIFIQCRIF